MTVQRLTASLLLVFAFLGLSVGQAWPQSQGGGPWKIGVLWDARGVPPRLVPLSDWLLEDLKAQGFAEKDLRLIVRQVEDPEAFRDAARELIKEQVNVIWTSDAIPALAAKAETREIPIVFGVASDPIRSGLVEGLAKPGGNATGVAFQLGQLAEKRLEILKEIVPRLRRVLVTVNPAYVLTQPILQELRAAARQLSVILVEQTVTSKDDIERLPGILKRDRVDGIIHIHNPTMNQHRELARRAIHEARVPDMSYYLPAVEQGLAMAAYNVNHREAWRASARLLAKILRGTKPQDLPVEFVDIIELHINLRVANERGVQVPQAILHRAHKVFQ